MKILFVVPYVPSMIRIRPYSLIRFLASRGHKIHLATLWTGEQEQADLEDIKPYCQEVTAFNLPRWRSFLNCLLAVPTPMPLQYVYCWHASLWREIHSLLNFNGSAVRIGTDPDGAAPFDVIHVEHLRGARYGARMQSSQSLEKNLPPVVWDSVDCISLLFRYTAQENKSIWTRLITSFDLRRTARCEAQLIRRFTRTVVTSPKDRDALFNLQPGFRSEKLTVVSNGVDLDYFQIGDPTLRKPATLVMSGKMSYHANVAMAHYLVEEILPLVWVQKPEVELIIVGKDPPPAVHDFTRDPRIHVTGTVPDIRPFLQEATMAAAPLRYGVGVQNKVLEAMACGTPIVTTPQVLSSLDAVPGQDLVVADTRQSFAQAILSLLEDAQLRNRIGLAGRKYVEETHSWNAIVDRLEAVYHSAIEEAKK
jgi:polysaccharide biosynthesis protein PslH